MALVQLHPHVTIPPKKLIKITNHNGICPKENFLKCTTYRYFFMCILNNQRWQKTHEVFFYLRTIGQKHHILVYLLGDVNKSNGACILYNFFIHIWRMHTCICWIKGKIKVKRCFPLCSKNIHGKMILFHTQNLYKRNWDTCIPTEKKSMFT